MVQPAEYRAGDDLPTIGRLQELRLRFRWPPSKRTVRSGNVVVLDVLPHQPQKVALI